MVRRSMLVDNSAQRASIRGNRLRQRSLPINRFALEILEQRQLLATITVNTASDAGAAGRRFPYARRSRFPTARSPSRHSQVRNKPW